MNRVVVVTGATGGIGRAICHTLSAEGYVIVAHYRNRHRTARELVRSMRERDRKCYLVAADFAEVDGVARVVAAVDNVLEQNSAYRLWGLVNNAARLLGPSFSEATEEEFDDYFAINLKAPFFLSQRLMARMSPGGGIVNISSASAHFSSPGDIVYSMTKASLESLTKNAAEPLASQGLRVNTIVPGFTDNGHEAFCDHDIRQYMSSFSVLGDVAAPETVAEAVSFLISGRSSRTTGAVLDVSGGSLLAARGSGAQSVATLLEERKITWEASERYTP